MTERIYILSRTGNLINDPAIDFATNLRFDSQAPGGHRTCVFEVKRPDVFAQWDVVERQTVLVKDGTTILWEGVIAKLPKQIGGGDEGITVECVGKDVYLRERLIISRWYHQVNPKDYFRQTNLLSSDTGVFYIYQAREDHIEVCIGTGDVVRNGEQLHSDYIIPQGYGYSQYVRRMESAYAARTGETITYVVYNIDQATAEATANATSVPLGTTGTNSSDMNAGNTTGVRIQLTQSNDTFDQNDWIRIHSIVISARYQPGHRALGSEAYSQDELIEDVILMINAKGGGVLSTDFDGWTAPAEVIAPYIVDPPRYAIDIIVELLSYGDDDGATYLYYVWDRGLTNDGAPKFDIQKRDTNHWDYELRIGDPFTHSVTYHLDDGELYNKAFVQYYDDTNVRTIRTPADNSDLQDQDSIDADDPREYLLNVGHASSQAADALGKRFLTLHKDRLPQAGFVVHDRIRTASGGWESYNRIRAGSRLRVEQLGMTFFLRSVVVDTEQRLVTLTPDMPPDGLAQILAKMRFDEDVTRRQQRTDKV